MSIHVYQDPITSEWDDDYCRGCGHNWGGFLNDYGYCVNCWDEDGDEDGEGE